MIVLVSRNSSSSWRRWLLQHQCFFTSLVVVFDSPNLNHTRKLELQRSLRIELFSFLVPTLQEYSLQGGQNRCPKSNLLSTTVLQLQKWRISHRNEFIYLVTCTDVLQASFSQAWRFTLVVYYLSTARRGEHVPHDLAVKAESERRIRENGWSPFIAVRHSKLSHSLPWKVDNELKQEYGFRNLRWERESEGKVFYQRNCP